MHLKAALLFLPAPAYEMLARAHHLMKQVLGSVKSTYISYIVSSLQSFQYIPAGMRQQGRFVERKAVRTKTSFAPVNGMAGQEARIGKMNKNKIIL